MHDSQTTQPSSEELSEDRNDDPTDRRQLIENLAYLVVRRQRRLTRSTSDEQGRSGSDCADASLGPETRHV